MADGRYRDGPQPCPFDLDDPAVREACDIAAVFRLRPAGMTEHRLAELVGMSQSWASPSVSPERDSTTPPTSASDLGAAGHDRDEVWTAPAPPSRPVRAHRTGRTGRRPPQGHRPRLLCPPARRRGCGIAGIFSTLTLAAGSPNLSSPTPATWNRSGDCSGYSLREPTSLSGHCGRQRQWRPPCPATRGAMTSSAFLDLSDTDRYLLRRLAVRQHVPAEELAAGLTPTKIDQQRPGARETLRTPRSDRS
jgi:hypothetical protein